MCFVDAVSFAMDFFVKISLFNCRHFRVFRWVPLTTVDGRNPAPPGMYKTL